MGEQGVLELEVVTTHAIPLTIGGSSLLAVALRVIVSGIEAKFVRTDHHVGTLKLRCNYMKVNMRGECPIVGLSLFGMCSVKTGG